MARRARVIVFGSATALVIAGIVCLALVGGVIGEVLAVVLLSAGLAGALLAVFFEIGLSEEHELAREAERRRTRARHGLEGRWPWRLRPRRRRPG